MAWLGAGIAGRAAEPEWVPIFDGETLNGWRVSAKSGHSRTSGHTSGGRWVVEDGAIVGSQDVPGNGGILLSTGAYGDFEVALEMNNDFGPDSGLFLRSTEDGRAWQAMIDYHAHGNLMGLYGEGLGGRPAVSNFRFDGAVDRVRVVTNAPVPFPLLPESWPSFWRHGQWNELRARIVGNPPRITTWINGLRIMEWQETELRHPARGAIGLQVHGGGDLTRQFVRYRNVRVRELDRDTAAIGERFPVGEWVPLFNGRNLDGWIPKVRHHPAGVNFANTFQVRDGVIRVDYDGYGGRFEERFGHLFHEQPFGHYRLRVEYRFVGNQLPDGPGWARRNSGLMLHGQSPESMALDQDFPVSIEVQLLGGLGSGRRTTANLCTPGTHVVMDGRLITRHCTDSTSETYHGDRWVTVEVEVRGSRSIRHLVEGDLVLAYSDPQLDEGDRYGGPLAKGRPVLLSEGTISLQSESHPVEFRRVELMRLAEE